MQVSTWIMLTWEAHLELESYSNGNVELSEHWSIGQWNRNSDNDHMVASKPCVCSCKQDMPPSLKIVAKSSTTGKIMSHTISNKGSTGFRDAHMGPILRWVLVGCHLHREASSASLGGHNKEQKIQQPQPLHQWLAMTRTGQFPHYCYDDKHEVYGSMCYPCANHRILLMAAK